MTERITKSMAKNIYYGGGTFALLIFLALTFDTVHQIPERSHEVNMTESVVAGKALWEKNNCVGCHTLIGEGAYYAPELTKVYERRGPVFIDSMLKDPESMYPGQRKMVKYDFTESQRQDLIAFLKWIGEMDLNGFPPKPDLAPASGTKIGMAEQPQVFKQLCTACHSVGGQGGNVGPALDGVGSRLDSNYISKWLVDPLAVKPSSKMPKLPLTEAQISELTQYLSQLKGETK